MIDLSLIIPVYFEEEVMPKSIEEITKELELLQLSYEIIFIDDGSKDKTVKIIKEYAQKDDRIKLVEFSYNHGKQAAVTAGITYSSGKYLLYMDPDLQDPPHEIKRFYTEIQKGYDLVFGVREEKMDGFFNKLFSKIFWGTLRKFTGLELPKGLAVMRMFNRKFANKFLEYKEQNRFIEGVFMHVGMKNTAITIEQRERFAGVSKFTFKRKMNLAFNAIFDFSELPLKTAVKFGFILSLLGILSLVVILFLKLFLIDFQAGWSSLISVIIMSTGLIIFFIGILAIYIGKIYKEVKQRPLFSVMELTNLKSLK